MIDRLSDLQSMAASSAASSAGAAPQSPGTLGGGLLGRRWSTLGSPRSPLRRPQPQEDTRLQVFLARLDEITRGPLHELEAQLLEARALHPHALNATTPRAEQEALARAEACAECASSAASRACEALSALAEEARSGAGNDTEASLRRQSYSGVSVLLQSALNSYFQEQQTFRTQMEAKVNRQLRAAFPGADDTDLAAVAQGQSAASAIQETVRQQPGLGPLDSAMALQMSRERRDELAKFARAARELLQVARDVKSLADLQGEVIDDIGVHVEAQRTRTTEVREDLEFTIASRARRRRWYGFCTLAILILVMVLLIPLIFIILARKKSGNHSTTVRYLVTCVIAGLPIDCEGGIAAS